MVFASEFRFTLHGFEKVKEILKTRATHLILVESILTIKMWESNTLQTSSTANFVDDIIIHQKCSKDELAQLYSHSPIVLIGHKR